MSKFYNIRGIVECPRMTRDKFVEKFEDFIEENGCFFAGVFEERHEEIEGELYVGGEIVAKLSAKDMRGLKSAASHRKRKYYKETGDHKAECILRTCGRKFRCVGYHGWEEVEEQGNE